MNPQPEQPLKPNLKPHSNELVAVFGHRGSGKSTWLFEHIDEFKPFVLVDPLFDPKFKAMNLYTLTSCGQALQLFNDAQPQRIYISPNAETFDFFCALVLAKGNMTLIVDEIDNYCTSYYMPPYLKKIIKIGRHQNVNLIAVCRRPKEMNPLIRSQANRFVVFPLGGEDAYELRSYLPATILDKIVELRESNDGAEYLEYNFKTKEYFIGKVNFKLDKVYKNN